MLIAAWLALAGAFPASLARQSRCPAPHSMPRPHLAARRAAVPRAAAQANLGDRFVRLVKANLNKALSSAEDPEKVLDQAVIDMQTDLVKIRQSYAEVTASNRRMKEQMLAAEDEAGKWCARRPRRRAARCRAAGRPSRAPHGARRTALPSLLPAGRPSFPPSRLRAPAAGSFARRYTRAQLALEKGEEDLAREALERRRSQDDLASNLAAQLTQQDGSLTGLFDAMKELESKITEAKMKKDQCVCAQRHAARGVDGSGRALRRAARAAVARALTRPRCIAPSSPGCALPPPPRFPAPLGTLRARARPRRRPR